ncbi:polyketide cyclase/dehydrase/lipid transport protein [Chitinophaga skermanii]|uniref:Polyketide cyclase/dehydrase/lipid transport protein n=1 Tax=Chitinophaga skermanii TaxID=331697 RepID=A0A327QB66_9BACT|nr:SRPBCC family protein [Chitinophaga skermanii]RAJ01531.1 polyketide cyclase/dehydrase/lipid transport protein [Chitinophaga skermanii]
MPTIHLTTVIHAPIERVFDLSRSITLHKKSMHHMQEEAVKGRTNGLIEYNETVTWRAKHINKMRELTVKITEMKKHSHFIDEMIQGDFKHMKHEHYFKPIDNGTVMIDVFEFGTPYGSIGRLFEKFYLTKYMKRLLETRNEAIKDYAESEKWRVVLSY